MKEKFEGRSSFDQKTEKETNTVFYTNHNKTEKNINICTNEREGAETSEMPLQQLKTLLPPCLLRILASSSG